MWWIDFLLVFFFLLYFLTDFRRGFLHLMAELIGVLAAFAVAIRYYLPLAETFSQTTALPLVLTKTICFIVIWTVIRLIFYAATKIISFYTPEKIKTSKLNIYSGLVPALIKGAVFTALMLVLIISAPLSTGFKNNLTKSVIACAVIRGSFQIMQKSEAIFSKESFGNLALITNRNDSVESEKLNFTTNDYIIDNAGETEMVKLLNQERASAGYKPLEENQLLRNIARSYAREMLLGGFFSHVSPNGLDLTDRLRQANFNYKTAGENLALAPTIEVANIGLLNSPGHRANILDPSYTKIGIGVLSAGPYGLIIVQIFAN